MGRRTRLNKGIATSGAASDKYFVKMRTMSFNDYNSRFSMNRQLIRKSPRYALWNLRLKIQTDINIACCHRACSWSSWPRGSSKGPRAAGCGLTGCYRRISVRCCDWHPIQWYGRDNSTLIIHTLLAHCSHNASGCLCGSFELSNRLSSPPKIAMPQRQGWSMANKLKLFIEETSRYIH